MKASYQDFADAELVLFVFLLRNCYNFSAECVEMNDTVINFYVQLLACFLCSLGTGCKETD